MSVPSDFASYVTMQVHDFLSLTVQDTVILSPPPTCRMRGDLSPPFYTTNRFQTAAVEGRDQVVIRGHSGI